MALEEPAEPRSNRLLIPIPGRIITCDYCGLEKPK
jgi:hypothetical protein